MIIYYTYVSKIPDPNTVRLAFQDMHATMESFFASCDATYTLKVVPTSCIERLRKRGLRALQHRYDSINLTDWNREHNWKIKL